MSGVSIPNQCRKLIDGARQTWQTTHMPEETPQAEAVNNPSQTASENTEMQVAETALEATNTQPTTGAEAELDIEGMDAKAYGELMEKFQRGELVVKAQETTEPEPKPEQTQTTEEEPEKKAADRIRLTEFEDHEKEALALVRDLRKDGKTITLTEALKRVEAKYGIEEPAKSEPAKPDELAPAPKSNDLEAKLQQLRKDFKKAGDDVDTSLMASLLQEIEDTRDQIAEAKVAEQQRETEAQSAIKAVQAEMVEKFPDLKKGTPLASKWDEIHDRLTAEGSAILNDPVNATRFITLLAASELGIAPVVKGQKPKASAPVPPINPAKPKPPVQPGSGALRSSTPTDQTAQLEQEIDAVKSVEELEKLQERLLGRR